MNSTKSENIYDMNLISEVKKHTGPKKLKEIITNLKNFSKKNVKEFSELQIEIFKEEKEEKKPEFKISAPIIRLQYYNKDLKKKYPKPTVSNNNISYGRKNTPSTVFCNEEELKQVDSSDFSDDE